MPENFVPRTDQAMRPDAVLEYRGIEFARWGQCVIPEGETRDPVPPVYSCADVVEVGEMRLDFATAEALAVRLQTAIAYERAKAATPPTAVVSK